jgi:hypothetical protein
MSKSGDMEIEDDRGEEEEIYEQDEVVWAKIKGYPWWPGYVIS